MKTIVCRAAAAGLLTLLASGAGAWALPGDEKGREEKTERIDRRRLVIVGPDGKEQVIEGHGPLVRRGYLGVGLTEMSPQLRTHFGAPEDAGVMISSVEPGSPAEKAGLKVGDIISRIDGQDVQSSWDIGSQMRKAEEGEQVPLEIWRNGKVQTLSATIAFRERPELDMAPFLLRRGEGEEDALMFRLDRERLPSRTELPPPGGPGAGPRELRIERTPRERLLERRLQELEKRIDELERQLEKKDR